jgi:hypothetical protein
MNSKKINILGITSKSLEEKKYLDVFPEYYKLAAVTENSLWHNNQNVLDHVIDVFAGLKTVLQFEDLKIDQVSKLKKYLSEIIGRKTRQDILKVATLLHDIAKTDTLVKRPDGTVGCPGHELIAAGRVKKFAERFELDKADEAYVERIVRYHGFISEILNLIIANGNRKKYLTIFKETVDDVAVELTLLMHADLLGCDLKKADKNGFDVRTELLAWILQKLLKEIKC